MNTPTAEIIAQFAAFDHEILYPVTIVKDVKTGRGNVLARAGEQTWGAVNADTGGVSVWTPNHYAGVKSSSVRASKVRVDYTRPVSIG